MHQPFRSQSAAHARAVETDPRPAAIAARAPLVPLQHSIGNRAVGRLVQAKLIVGRPGDRFEREADRVADQVMRMPDGAAPAGIAAGAASANAVRAGRDSAGGEAVGGADRSASPPTPGAAVLAALSGGAAGSPLPRAARAFFEPRLGADLSAVRLHTGPAAGAAAADIGAKAFTYGQSIYFGHGRSAAASGAGQRLLAHELVHTVQQAGGSGGLIQADFESDFAGRPETLVSETTVVPPRTIRVTNPAGEAVWAPYGIYRPSEVPEAHQGLIMEAQKAYQWRNPDEAPLVAHEREQARGENAGELSVRDMTRLAESRRAMNIRVMIARVGKDFLFVGYDMSRGFPGGKVDTGFVESERGTALVGQKLLADRTVRALQSAAPGMELEVYASKQTADFHARIYQAIGRQGRPDAGQHLHPHPARDDPPRGCLERAPERCAARAARSARRGRERADRGRRAARVPGRPDAGTRRRHAAAPAASQRGRIRRRLAPRAAGQVDQRGDARQVGQPAVVRRDRRRHAEAGDPWRLGREAGREAGAASGRAESHLHARQRHLPHASHAGDRSRGVRSRDTHKGAGQDDRGGRRCPGSLGDSPQQHPRSRRRRKPSSGSTHFCAKPRRFAGEAIPLSCRSWRRSRTTSTPSPRSPASAIRGRSCTSNRWIS